MRAPSKDQTRNNHGNGCPFGQCQPKTGVHPKGGFNGRTIEFYSGTCPGNSAASSGFVGLSTKVGEPADIFGHGGWKKGRASLGEIIWSLWGKVSGR